MSTATADTKVCEHRIVNCETHICRDCDQFVMPLILQGDDVAYYDSTLAESRKVLGFVMKVRNTKRSVTVFVPSSGAVFELVRHVSDPKVKDAPEFRENGCWDYSDRYKLQTAALADLNARVTRLEAKLKKE